MEREDEKRRAEARDLVASWVLALWAVGVGIYLTMGGVKHLVSPAYTYLIELVNGNYHLVGVALLIGGIINIIGVSTNSPVLLGVGAVLCGGWLAGVALCMALASFTITDGGNLNWTTAIGLSALYFIRAYNKFRPPHIPPMVGLLTLAVLWFA